ncbi:hypothetical protein AVEN_203360-1, partial [Araneus ventricosus]
PRFEERRGLFWERPRNFEPWSDNEDGILDDSTYSNSRATPAAEHLTPMELMCIRPAYTTILRWNRAWHLKPFGQHQAIVTTKNDLQSTHAHFYISKHKIQVTTAQRTWSSSLDRTCDRRNALEKQLIETEAERGAGWARHRRYHSIHTSSVCGRHIYKPYPDRTETGNQSTSLATRSSDVVFSSRTKRTAIITKQESSHFSSPFSHS